MTATSATRCRFSIRRLLQFRLRTLLIGITAFLVVGGGLLNWWRAPFEVETLGTGSAWRHDTLLDDHLLRLARQAGESIWADKPGAPPRIRYREVYRVYRNLRGEHVRHGPAMVRDDITGCKLRTEHWQHGTLHGQWTDWHPDGSVIASGEWHNGLEHGTWITHERRGGIRREAVYEFGNLLCRTVFIHGVRSREDDVRANGSVRRRYWSRQGRLMTDTWLVKEVRHGLDRGFHTNGKPRYEGHWLNGQEDGRWRWWRDDGKLIRDVEFTNGQFIHQGVELPSILPEDSDSPESAYLESQLAMSARQPSYRHGGRRSTDLRLEDFVNRLGLRPAILNRRALDAAGISTTLHVSLEVLEPMTRRAAVQMVLAPHDLVLVIRHDMFMVTTRKDRESWRDRTGLPQLLANSRSIPAQRIVGPYGRPGGPPVDAKASAYSLLFHCNHVDFTFDDSCDLAKLRRIPSSLTYRPLQDVRTYSLLSFVFDEQGLACREEGGRLLIYDAAMAE